MRLSQTIYLAPLVALLAQGLPLSDAAAETGIIVRAADDEAWAFQTDGAAKVESKRAADDEAWAFQTDGAAKVETERAAEVDA
ncbi:uncharacterized protein TRUGW13939_02456 [Talaromyces rugulosus]|uniref:Uncharacterized protein n=1 Tax=Talaromyces rugulosus TaxID=121627 RepID=A0A7H8QN67_TALRU|nr:uncharacterized protein TRUGW13939_02456 [Talaromyces rugulosus]QKX55364.1 hypothetical protein TRUGW13939_02456 [Talaromyces rugulosus]